VGDNEERILLLLGWCVFEMYILISFILLGSVFITCHSTNFISSYSDWSVMIIILKYFVR